MSETQPLRVVLAGGGTGGHLYPAIALAQEIERRGNTEILFVGTSYGLEDKVIPQTHYKFRKVAVRGLHRGQVVANLLFPARLAVSLVQCGLILRDFKPQLVVGTGGYVSGPALMAAIFMRIPTAIQEQNSYPGLVNRLLGKWVSQVHINFEDSRPYFRGQENLFVSGNPVRGDLLRADRPAALRKFGLAENKTTLFVFGGSQGARAINQAVLRALDRLLAIGNLQILWATGPADWPKIAEQCSPAGERVSCQAYIEDMASAYALADFALCRSGASTLAELALCGLPAILVPLPTAAAGHQEFNARSFHKQGAAILLLQKDLSPETLVENVARLAENRGQRITMSALARKMARPDATKDIVDKLISLI